MAHPTLPSGTLILDGALATELERRTSTPLDTPLWSAHTLLAAPHLVQAVHAAYFSAGADVAITASYQASTRGLMLHSAPPGMSEAQAADVVARSVRVARDAAAEVESGEEVRRQRIVAGSVGPFGAFLADGSEYSGLYGRQGEAFREEMKVFHRPRIAALVDAGVDLLALETMPCFGEVVALGELLRDDFPGTRAWVSCTVRFGEDGDAVLSDGASLRSVCEALEQFEQIIAVGVNCCPKGIVTPALREMRRWTGKPLVAYPNSGEAWNAETKTWSEGEGDGKSWYEYVAEWEGEGARYIGGCCRTTPDDIREIKECCSHVK